MGISSLIDKTNASSAATELQLLQKLFKNVPGIVYQFQLFDDGSFCFPHISNGAVSLFGYTTEEIMMDASKIFSKIHPGDRESFYRARKVSQKELIYINIDMLYSTIPR